MSRDYRSRIRKIEKIGKGTYFTRNYSVGFYFIKTIIDFFVSIIICFVKLPIRIITFPFRIFKSKTNIK